MIFRKRRNNKNTVELPPSKGMGIGGELPARSGKRCRNIRKEARVKPRNDQGHGNTFRKRNSTIF
jgi:hypothetical protein